MLETIVLAGALFVCPGDVYSDTPRAGCHPLQDSSKEGFSTVKEAPEFDSKTPMPAGSDGERRQGLPIPYSGGVRAGLRDVRGMGQVVHQVEQHRSPRSFAGRVRTVDESQASLREQSASQLSVIIPCLRAGSVNSCRIRLSPSSFVSLTRVYLRDFRSPPDTGLSELPDNLTVGLLDVSLPE